MSFSSDVKNELAKQYSKSRHCQIAELTGMFLMEGELNEAGTCMEFHTDNMVLMEKFALLLKKAFSVDITKVLEEEDSKRILAAMKIVPQEFLMGENSRVANGMILQKTCCKRAFLRGVFMAAGSISDPSKSYHFEIVCRSREQASQLQKIMESFQTEAKIVERKNHYVVYLKDGSQIVDMLNVMEAYVSLMNLENVRILKEMRNSVNRKVNCETANIGKTVNAAVKQIADIELIRDRLGLDNLPDNLREMALLRLEYPEAALKELGKYLEPPVGKSGVNHRLRKLGEIADKLRGQ